MSNEKTKAQLKRFFDKAVREAKNPDQRKILKKKRELKKKEIAKNYGLNL